MAVLMSSSVCPMGSFISVKRSIFYFLQGGFNIGGMRYVCCQRAYARLNIIHLISMIFQRIDYFQFVNPGEVRRVAGRQCISPFKAGGCNEGVAKREFALLA